MADSVEIRGRIVEAIRYEGMPVITAYINQNRMIAKRDMIQNMNVLKTVMTSLLK